MSDMRKLLESMTKFAGEPAQKPGDQVRGTERATKKKSGEHPFHGRLVGGESIIKELEKQLVEGDVERRLREEFEQFNEFAPGQGGGGSGDYFQALASAWYNGVFNTGSLPRGIKTQEDVERLLNRGIVCPDGKTRKLHIDYNSDFDGVEIYSDDYYEYGDHDDTIDSRTGQKWGPYDFMAFSGSQLDEATGDQKFDSMLSQMTSEPKYPDQDMPPTSISELIQWADTNNKPYHEYFAQWARKNGFKNVNDALVWFGDNVDPSNPWGPKDFVDPLGRPAAEELEDAAKHDPKAAELMKVFRCYEEIVFDWPDEYRQMNMPTSRKGTDESLNEFAADDSGDSGEDDALRKYAQMWWNGDDATQQKIEAALARVGWEIGEDEGGYDNGGVFVVRAGDVNGRSYVSWSAEELEGLGEGIFGFGTETTPAKDKSEPVDDLSAKLLARRQKQQVQPPKEKIYRSPEEYRQEKEHGVEEGLFGFMSKAKPEPVKKKETPDAFADKLDAQRIKNLTQHKPSLADKKKPNVRVITKYTEENVTENEGDPEGLPHLTKELLTHIVDQVGKEGAHAIVKSLTWGDGAAKELLHLIVNDLEDDIQQGLEKQNYKKLPDKITELGANNPPQPNSAMAGTATTAPVDPKAAAALKQSLMKLKTSVPGLDVTKAATAMTKADTGVPLTPGDKNTASVIAPQLANVMKNPQMASSLKMMIDKANQQEKAAAVKPPGTV